MMLVWTGWDEGDKAQAESFRRFRELELLVRYHDARIKGAEQRERTLDRKARDKEKARQEAEAEKKTRDAA